MASDESSEKLDYVCPACNLAQLTPVGSNVRGDDPDHDYLCTECGHTTDTPRQRESRKDGNHLSGIAKTVSETDADEVGRPITDGGLDDETAADLLEGIAHSAEPALKEEEHEDLAAVIEHLRDDDDDQSTAPRIVPDGGQFETANAPDDGELSRFQQDILRTLARDGESYGLKIKRELESEYAEEVNHGRLYPNLDTLVKADFVEKRELDKRTNGYRLTDAGRDIVRRLAQQWVNASDVLNGGEN